MRRVACSTSPPRSTSGCSTRAGRCRRGAPSPRACRRRFHRPPGRAGSSAGRRAPGLRERGARRLDAPPLLGLLRALAAARVALYLDAGAYPTPRWGAERAAGAGPVRLFPHHDAEALARLVAAAAPGRPPVVVCDGLCARCGRCAPLAGFLGVVAPRGGRSSSTTRRLWTARRALGGGAALRVRRRGRAGRIGLSDPRVLAVVSFAKALGHRSRRCWARMRVAAYERASGCREHSSPPSAVALRALARGLEVNENVGDDLRARLAARIERFRTGVRRCGLTPGAHRFPVQPLSGPGLTAAVVHRALLGAGVRTVLRAGRSGPELCLVVTARHAARDVDRAVGTLAAATREHRSRFTTSRS